VAAGDRNDVYDPFEVAVLPFWRPPSAAAEDRNYDTATAQTYVAATAGGRRPRWPRIATNSWACPG
jgi:hypothetical protein